MSAAKVKSLDFMLVYSEDLEKTTDFYSKYLGFEKKMDFSETEVFGTLGDIQVWIGSNYKPHAEHSPKHCRLNAMLIIDSCRDLHKILSADGVKVHQEPQEMQPGVYWMMFEDPSGNLLEVLGD